jgi:hypothetical protein
MAIVVKSGGNPAPALVGAYAGERWGTEAAPNFVFITKYFFSSTITAYGF